MKTQGLWGAGVGDIITTNLIDTTLSKYFNSRQFYPSLVIPLKAVSHSCITI